MPLSPVNLCPIYRHNLNCTTQFRHFATETSLALNGFVFHPAATVVRQLSRRRDNLLGAEKNRPRSGTVSICAGWALEASCGSAFGASAAQTYDAPLSRNHADCP